MPSGDRWSYVIGERVWDDFRSFCRDRYAPHRLFVVIDEQVDRLHGEEIRRECGKQFEECIFLKVPQGEQSKSLQEWERLVTLLLERGIERETPVLAVGGGVTGDLAGFVASAALRGVPLIHMPTTLLAMVDSSLGGKTGVNHPEGKNLVGAFYQPDAVFVHLPFLDTLPEREWINGLAEIVKYGAIRRPDLLGPMAEAAESGFTRSPLWREIILECARVKSEIVEADVLERGTRIWLNFGHTFGHALEKIAGYGNISHGEAVFIGMVAAVYASSRLGAPVEIDRLEPFIPLYTAPYRRWSDETGRLVEAMKGDKKMKNRTLRLVILQNWGEPGVHPCNDDELLKASWQFAFDQF